MITKTVNIKLELTPKDLAEEFCEMDSDEQVEFFNYVGKLSKDWDKPFALQCQSMKDSEVITKDGKKIIEVLWDYLA